MSTKSNKKTTALSLMDAGYFIVGTYVSLMIAFGIIDISPDNLLDRDSILVGGLLGAIFGYILFLLCGINGIRIAKMLTREERAADFHKGALATWLMKFVGPFCASMGYARALATLSFLYTISAVGGLMLWTGVHGENDVARGMGIVVAVFSFVATIVINYTVIRHAAENNGATYANYEGYRVTLP